MVSEPSAAKPQLLALGADRVAVERVRREEVLLVVEGERPEALDWRELVFAEGQGVALGAVEPRTPAVEILIEVARLARAG